MGHIFRALMTNFKERVLLEHSELESRMKSLCAFFDTPAFQDLADVDKRLLAQQYAHMEDYKWVLSKRIERFTAACK